MAMAVEIEGVGSLKSAVPAGMVLADVETVGQAIERLAVPADVGVAMLVNGRVAHWNSELHDGDVLTLLPAICGGSSN
jgi:molybdopterin converting factor small subunit